jgi:hypothetical protein
VSHYPGAHLGALMSIAPDARHAVASRSLICTGHLREQASRRVPGRCVLLCCAPVAPSSDKALTCQAYDASTRSIVPTFTRSSSATYTGREASKRAVEVYAYDLQRTRGFSDLNTTRGFSDLDVFEDFRTSTHSRIFEVSGLRCCS